MKINGLRVKVNSISVNWPPSINEVNVSVKGTLLAGLKGDSFDIQNIMDIEINFKTSQENAHLIVQEHKGELPFMSIG